MTIISVSGENIPFEVDWNGIKNCPGFTLRAGQTFGDAVRTLGCNCPFCHAVLNEDSCDCKVCLQWRGGYTVSERDALERAMIEADGDSTASQV